MTDKPTPTPTPTDAEIIAVAATEGVRVRTGAAAIKFARAVLAKWGQPAVAGEPDFYTACAWYEGGGVGEWIALPGYSNETEHGVKHLVLEAARNEGYKGTAAGRLLELGWEIRPVFLTQPPTHAQAGAMPLDEARRMFDAGWKAAAMFCDREDVVADGIIGFGACPQFEAAFSAARGIKGAQRGTE